MHRIFFMLLLVEITLSAFSRNSHEEKALQALLQSAEQAFLNQHFSDAKTAYGELIERVSVRSRSRYPVDWPTYVDLVMRYAEACAHGGELQEGEQALTRLLAHQPPTEQLPRIYLFLSRFTSHHQSLGELYTVLQAVKTTFSVDAWRKEDLSLYHALEYALNEHYDRLSQQGRRYATAGYYPEAIAAYTEVLEGIESGQYPNAAHPVIEKKIRFHLAESYYQQRLSEQQLTLDYNGASVEDAVDRESLCLAIAWYQAKNAYETALEQALHEEPFFDRNNLDNLETACLEQGIAYYHAKAFPEAQKLLEKIHYHETLTCTAALYLARIYLQLGATDRVSDLLTPLRSRLEATPLWRYELAYLQGEAAYAQSNYAEAKKWLSYALQHGGEEAKESERMRLLIAAMEPPSSLSDAETAEADFCYYPYEAYSSGAPEALSHLRTFLVRFPHSPLATVGYELLGSQESDGDKAIAYFDQAILSFFLHRTEKMPLLVFSSYYRAKLSLAQQFETKGCLEAASTLVRSILADFSTPDHPYTRPLLEENPYPPLFAEAETQMVHFYLQSGKKRRAQAQLDQMLHHFADACIRKGKELASVWQTAGWLAYECHDYDTALTCFSLAEESGEGALSKEACCGLWQIQHQINNDKQALQQSLTPR